LEGFKALIYFGLRNLEELGFYLRIKFLILGETNITWKGGIRDYIY